MQQPQENGLNTEFECDQASGADRPETLDPNDSDRLRNQIKGQTTEHASPPRLEDEGQSGG